MDKESYYKRISFLGQRYILTEDTIRNNIIGNEVYLEEKYNRIIDGLNIKNFDKSNMVNENRDNLSGGEMQKISIARAIYKDSDILILDEPFSALDRTSVDRILDILLKDERSLIVIAHNLSNDKLNNFDKVINMKRSIKSSSI
ncbi:ATP-binding cassette domain-containing protein [Anaerococcus tetradius]|uniref:ATP-binding cassette domain-containing protein n=1 Tax=Anaerococcus tetradius TaxID=33036 RepID=UPI0030B85D72